MTRNSTAAAGVPQSPVGQALEEVTASFERFCLAAGLDVLGEMLEADAAALCGPRHGRGGERQAQRWGRTAGPIGFGAGRLGCGACPNLTGLTTSCSPRWIGRWRSSK